MTSVQENKNELESAVRYCESAISRAKQTIESMEFRQQAASKAWHEQTGREAALERELSELKQANMNLVCDNDDLKDEITELKLQYDEVKANMALLTDENLKLRETNNLQRDQIAMFQRKMTRLNEVDR